MLYDCYAVSNHYGSGPNAGHYTACVRNSENNKWYAMNDSAVTEISPARVVTANAYNLFYRHRDWHAYNM